MPIWLLYSLSGTWFLSLAGIYAFGGQAGSPAYWLFVPLTIASIVMLVVVPVDAYALASNKTLRTPANLLAFSTCAFPLVLYASAIVYGSMAWRI
jgi:hypothetical protein